MTQLDVPNISFTHYLDLLKRRTWLVVIVSILGLIVGGMVAMLIPRYYVAKTVVQFNRPVLDAQLGTPSDPMAQLVNAAPLNVRGGVRQAVADLGWLEALTGDEEQRRAFLAGVTERVRTKDMGPPNPGRRVAKIEIRYADTDGTRAATMANRVRTVWLEDHVEGLEKKASGELELVVQQKGVVKAQIVEARRLVMAYESEHAINPEDWRDERVGGAQSVLSTDIRSVNTEIGKTAREIAALVAKIRDRKGELELVSPTKPVNIQDRISDPVLRAEWTQLRQTARYTRRQLKNIKPAYPGYEATKFTLDEARAAIAELEAIAGGGAGAPNEANPRYEALKREIRGLSSSRGIAQTALETLRADLAKLEDRRGKLPGIYREYENLRQRLSSLVAEEQVRAAELRVKNEVMRRIRTEGHYEVLRFATVPPAPTEPSTLVLAVTGCVVGLGVALAFVLLIDLLQLTFKSVTEVESSLGLPVLGSLSYLETESEVRDVRARRARVMVFSVVFVVLLLTVVTIYYVAPTSLPGYVNEILDRILGEQR